MVHRMVAVVVAVVVVALQPAAARPASICGTPKAQALAASYRRYRAQKTANPDLRTPELSNWDGDMHRVMADLGVELAKSDATAECVERLLGPPDAVYTHGDRAYTGPVPTGECHLVYWWRGGHDVLYFVVRKNRVAAARWWFAYE